MNFSDTVVITVGVAVATAVIVTLMMLWLQRRSNREAPMAYLYRRHGRRVIKHDLCDDICRIGRHPDNEIQLKDDSVSRFHAQIVNNRNGSFLIRDLDSKNGVRIFFRHITSTVLQDGDVVYVGTVPMRFMRYPMDYKTVPDTVIVQGEQGQRFKKRQRRIERFKVDKVVRFYVDNLGWHIGRALDLSEEGLFIRTDMRIQLRTPIDIVMQDEHDAWIKMTGEVTRKEREGIGIVFTDVDRETKEKIHNIGLAATEPRAESLDEIETFLDVAEDELADTEPHPEISEQA